jgi:hypothetical protein
MSLTRRTSRSFILAVLVALWAVLCLPPAAASPPSPPVGSALDRNATSLSERQQSLDTWHGIRDYKGGDDQRRINLRMAIRARPNNGYTYVRAYIAVTCETLTREGWRRYPCSLEPTYLGIMKDTCCIRGWVTAVTENSGRDGFYSAYSHWRRTFCPYTTYLAVAHAGSWGGVTVGLYHEYFRIPPNFTGDYPQSYPYMLVCT